MLHVIMLIIQVYFKYAVFESEIKFVTRCYMRRLFSSIIPVLQVPAKTNVIANLHALRAV